MNYSRDGTRTPFPWDSSTNAGFSVSTHTWLPVANNYATVNVNAQKMVPFSHLKIFQTLTQLRHTQTMQEGALVSHTVNNDILTYTRTLAGYDTIVVVLNFGATQQTVNLQTLFTGLPANLEVITSSLASNYVGG